MTDARVPNQKQINSTSEALRRYHVTPAGWLTLLLTIISIVLACALSAILIAATGFSPGDAAQAMWDGSVAGASGWTTTLLYVAPLLLVAVGSCVCARAGIFNIGQEGQVLIGALGGAYAGLRLAIQGPLLLICVLVFGAIAGGIWAGLSSLMLRWRGVNVVVSTLLMTFVAQQIVGYAVNTSWFLQETPEGSSGIAGSESNPIPVNGRLRTFGQYPDLSVNFGLFLALAAAVIVAFLLVRTRWGFRLKLIGMNPITARHSGVRVAAIGGLSLAISGAFAGLAGAVDITGWEYRIGQNDIQLGGSSGIGFIGLAAALLGRNTALGVGFASLLFGALINGTSGRQLDPSIFRPDLAGNLTTIIQGLVILFVGLNLTGVVAWVRKRRRA
jgi:simple sugar transport system permease protein